MPIFFYKLRNPDAIPTFKTKALCLVSNVQLDKCLLFVTKATPINYIDGKCHKETERY